jgi:hypothetical protein
MLAAPILNDRSMTNYCAVGSRKGNRINSRWRPKKKEKRTSITTIQDQYLSFASFPAPLVSQWSLPLKHAEHTCQELMHSLSMRVSN